MTSIYLGNLDFTTSEDQLRTVFAAYGAVKAITIVTDRDTVAPRGFAFVEMISAGQAREAIRTLNGSTAGVRCWSMKLVPNSTAIANARVDSARLLRTRSGSETGGIMNTGSSKCLDSRAWRGLYKAALFEVDKTKRPERIAQAERALALRARELFHTAGDNIEEGEALDDAMYALHALRNRSQTSGRVLYRGAAA